MRLLLTSVLSTGLFLAVSPLAAAATPAPGRVAHLDGDLRLDNAGDASRSLITENAIVADGDELSTPPGSYAELEFAGSTFVRLAGGTSIAIDQLDDGLHVVLLDGLVSVYRGVNAPAASLLAFQSRIALDDDTEVRAEVERDALTAEVVVKSGRAERVTATGSELMAAGATLTERPGQDEHGTWDGQLDAFDRWIVERVQSFANRPAPPVAAAGYVGIDDLAGAGEWVDVGGQTCWRPFVDDEWRPYSAGTWSWVDPWGWVFVSDTSWGYVTHHYGRWLHDEGFGWLWVPDPVFGGAYVAWAVGGPYVGWAPLDPYGRAVVVGAYVDELDALVWIFADLSYFYWGGGWCDWDRTWVYVDQSTVNDWDVTVVTRPSDDLHPGCHDGHDDAPGKDPGKPKKPTLLSRRFAERSPERLLADAKDTAQILPRANPPRSGTHRAEPTKTPARGLGASRFDGLRAAGRQAATARGSAPSPTRRGPISPMAQRAPTPPAASRSPGLPLNPDRTRPSYGGVRTPVAPAERDTTVISLPYRRPRPAVESQPPQVRAPEAQAPIYRPSVPSPSIPSPSVPSPSIPTPSIPSPSIPSPSIPSPSIPTPSYRPSLPAAPTPSYRPSTPAPSYQPSAPAPSYHPSAPAPSYHPSAPAPSYHPSTPAPSYQPPPSNPPPASAPAPAKAAARAKKGNR